MRLPALAFLAMTGCASFGVWSGQSEAQLTFTDDADTNLAKGQKAYEQRNFVDAERYFEFVKTKFPYVEAANTAELGLGDARFAQDKWVEARDTYETFARLHPTHPKASYAAFRAALTHYKEVPSDFFILPPSSEKDQVSVKAALNALVDFVRNYPDSEERAEAEKVLAEVKRRLGDHELYVAEFYAKRGKWPAVVTRLTTLTRNYSGVGLDERAYFLLYEAHVKVGDLPRAQATLESYVKQHPDEPAAARARQLLAALPPRQP